MKILLQNKVVTIFFFFFAILMLSNKSSLSNGNEPINIMTNAINKFISIINSENYRNSENKAQFEKELRDIVNSIFNYRIFAEEILGEYWVNFNPRKQEEFISLFTEFLSKGFFKRIPKAYKNVEIKDTRQKFLPKNKAKVSVMLASGIDKTYLDYFLINNNGSWKCYDMILNGIQIVPLYKEQVYVFLNNSTPDNLLELLKNEIERLENNQKQTHFSPPE